MGMGGGLESGGTSGAGVLNARFGSVFAREGGVLPGLPPSAVPSVPGFAVSIGGVSELLSGLSPHKATGPDGVPARILKVAAMLRK